MGKSIEAAKVLLEEMASNNYHWASDRATTQRGSGKYAVDAVTLLAIRMDALAQRFEKVSSSLSPGGSLGSTVGVYAICKTCRVQGHTSAECYNGMVYLPLSTLMLFKVTSLHHSILPSSLPTIRGGRVILTHHTQTLSHLLKMPCDHLGFSLEQPTPHHLHRYLNHLRPTWRA